MLSQLLLVLLLCSGQCASLKLCKSLLLTQPDFTDSLSAERLLQHLHNVTAGCQYVHGDVTLRNIGVHPVSGRQLGGSAVRNLPSDFLDSIQEISGRLLLYRVNMRTVEFRSLRAVRGYNPLNLPNFASLEFRQMQFSTSLRLPMLAALLHGHVELNGEFDVGTFCHLAATVDWTGLFQSGGQRLRNNVNSVTMDGRPVEDFRVDTAEKFCQGVAVCDSACPADNAGQRFCWSAGPTGCQRTSRCSSSSCYSNICFRDGGAERCCHSDCLGGCSSNRPDGCASCRSVNFNGTCLQECPPNRTYDPGSGTLLPRGAGMLRAGNLCVPQCPDTFVTDAEGRYCLSECPPSEAPVDGRCTSCSASGGDCRVCQLPGPIFTDAAARQMRDGRCTIWRQAPRVSAVNVVGSGVGDNETLPTLLQARFVYTTGLYVKDVSVGGGLDFLRNLKFVSGQLVLMRLRARYLALAALKSAKLLHLRDVSGLCRQWLPLDFLQSSDCPFKFSSLRLQFDNHSAECAGAQCHDQCRRGCWGPGRHLCVACVGVRVGDSCFSSCRAAGRFAFNQSGILTCRPCHAECQFGCSGPDAAACDDCRSFRQHGRCVPACSVGYQPDAGRVCRAVVPAGVFVAAGAGAVLLLLLLLALVLSFYRHRRRLRKYEIVDLDERLGDPSCPEDMTQLLVVSDDDLVKEKEIGSGAFGTVFRGRLLAAAGRPHELPVAVKVLHGGSPSAGRELLAEAAVLARARHPNCVRLVAVCLTQQVQLVTTLMPRGCLLDFVRSRRDRLKAERMLSWGLQVAEGMAYLQSVGIVHRDLAARNVLLQTPDVVKITDFGLARLLVGGERQFQQTVSGNEKLPMKWLGVEYFESGQFGHQSDVWSYGVLLWEICSFGESPYSSQGARTAEDIGGLLRKGVRLPQPAVCSVGFYNILLTCWLPDPQSRPTFRDLVATMQDCLARPSSFIARGSKRQLEWTDDAGDTADKQASKSNFYVSDPARPTDTSDGLADDYLVPKKA